MFLPRDEIPRNFRCPITFEIMEDPVEMEDHYIYERDAITHWMAEHSNRSPMTNQVMSTNMIPNINLKNSISQYLQNKNGMIKVFLKDVDDRIVIVSINENQTLRHFKEEVKRLNGINEDEQFLVYMGKPLKNMDDKTLKELKIINGSTVNLLLRLKGGI